VRISERVHLIDGVRGANSYLFLTDEGTAIIDTGLPGNASRIVRFQEGLERSPRSITHIILTHPDIDHSGSVAQLKRDTKASVAIHRADAKRLSGEADLKEVKGAMGILYGVMRRFVKFTPVAPDILLEDSNTIAGLTVVHTPGHTDGSVSLYLPNEIVFIGDALRTTARGLPELPSRLMTLDMNQARESVRRISELRFSCLLPGHGPPITSNASSKLREFVSKGYKNEEKQSL
jgi:hydroxyacylglutathione hydrolase